MGTFDMRSDTVAPNNLVIILILPVLLVQEPVTVGRDPV
jgi:hypothetical protein